MLPGCSDDDATAPSDVTPPSRVDDLRAKQLGPSEIVLRWTAPGDDGDAGTASAYDGRKARFTLALGNWNTADPLTGLGAPRSAGAAESLVVTQLLAETDYHYALIVRDEAGNDSRMSNEVVFAIDTISPAAVTDLAADSVTDSTVILRWTSVGEDGGAGAAAASYDIRRAASTLTEASWDAAERLTGVPAPAIPGFQQGLLVERLEAATDYWFGLKVVDEAGNTSALSNVVEVRTLD